MCKYPKHGSKIYMPGGMTGTPDKWLQNEEQIFIGPDKMPAQDENAQNNSLKELTHALNAASRQIDEMRDRLRRGSLESLRIAGSLEVCVKLLELIANPFAQETARETLRFALKRLEKLASDNFDAT